MTAYQSTAEDHFCAPWSYTPTTHITLYGRQITRLQNKAVDVNLIITDAEKLRIFLKVICASMLIKHTFMDNYGSSRTKYCSTQYPIFVEEYDKIKRTDRRNAEVVEYKSNTAFSKTTHPRNLGVPRIPSCRSPSQLIRIQVHRGDGLLRRPRGRSGGIRIVVGIRRLNFRQKGTSRENEFGIGYSQRYHHRYGRHSSREHVKIDARKGSNRGGSDRTTHQGNGGVGCGVGERQRRRRR